MPVTIRIGRLDAAWSTLTLRATRLGRSVAVALALLAAVYLVGELLAGEPWSLLVTDLPPVFVPLPKLEPGWVRAVPA